MVLFSFSHHHYLGSPEWNSRWKIFEHRTNKCNIFSARKVYNLFCWQCSIKRCTLHTKEEIDKGAKEGLNCNILCGSPVLLVLWELKFLIKCIFKNHANLEKRIMKCVFKRIFSATTRRTLNWTLKTFWRYPLILESVKDVQHKYHEI